MCPTGMSLFVCLAALPVALLAQQPAGSSSPITVGETFTWRSAVMEEDRRVQVALPESYGSTNVGYPVLYVLDGSSNVVHVTAAAQFLANARNRIPELIVVSIPNTNRNRDLTPGPGAAKFEKFLADELIPWVEKNYRTLPERVLVGHSLGGSFVTHVMLNRPELFRGYVAISAPLWRYDSLDRDERAGVARAAKAGASIALLVGEKENPNIRGSVRDFADRLKAAPSGTAPQSSFADMPDEDHNSIFHRAIYNSLEARYVDYRLPLFEDSTELKDLGGMKGVIQHYRQFWANRGIESSAPPNRLLAAGQIEINAGRDEQVVDAAVGFANAYPAVSRQLINAAGYGRLRRNDAPAAVAAFRKNAELFPDFPNMFDSLGDGLCRTSDLTAALSARREAVKVAERLNHSRLAEFKAKLEKPCG